MTPDNNPLSGKILKQIRTGQVVMKPKIYFIGKVIAGFAAGVLALALALFVASFLVFLITRHGLWYLPKFGLPGLKALGADFPWVILLVAAALAVYLAALVKNNSFAYRKPAIYSFGAIILFMAAGGVALAGSGLHARLHNRAAAGELSILGTLYRGYEKKLGRQAFFGRIEEITGEGATLFTPEGKSVDIKIDGQTRLPSGNPQKGESVIVGASQRGGKTKAFGVEKINGSQAASAPGQLKKKLKMLYPKKILQGEKENSQSKKQ